MNPHEFVAKWLKELNLAIDAAIKEANFYHFHHLNRLKRPIHELRGPIAKNLRPFDRKEVQRQESSMKTEDAIVQIYKACKEVAPELSAKEHVSNLIFNIIADLELDQKKITPKKIEQLLREHALFTQRCVRTKRKVA